MSAKTFIVRTPSSSAYISGGEPVCRYSKTTGQKIKEISQILGLTKHAIRYYTDEGLLPSVQRDSKNNRLFDERAVNGLNLIKCLKHSGMSIKDIKHYVDLCEKGDSTIPARYEIIRVQKETARAQLVEAQQRLYYLEIKEQKYQELLAASNNTV